VSYESVEQTRAEHMQWLKQRALTELEYGTFEALASVLSDLTKHPMADDSLLRHLTMAEMAQAKAGNRDETQVRRFIEELR